MTSDLTPEQWGIMHSSWGSHKYELISTEWGRVNVFSPKYDPWFTPKTIGFVYSWYRAAYQISSWSDQAFWIHAVNKIVRVVTCDSYDRWPESVGIVYTISDFGAHIPSMSLIHPAGLSYCVNKLEMAKISIFLQFHIAFPQNDPQSTPKQ